MDSVTSQWIIDSSDELAVRNGCWFEPLVGAYTVWWMERYCRLYEGEGAGDPMHLRGRHDEQLGCWEIPDEFDERMALERHEHFIAGYRSGVPCDWQYLCIMRLFGWKRRSDRWKRDVRRFRKGGFWVPKKNKKSPTLAGIGLYLTCGDGEQGQKVALLAKDGAQARDIAGKHVIEMVRASDELDQSKGGECKINLNECSVEHLPTRSIIKPFSSSNARNKEAKEGFNGSLLVDETHVVDRDFMKRMKRAGISRSEFIHLEVSTAGNNPDGYGKERFDYGAKVASGSVETDEFCYMAFAAPQNVVVSAEDGDEVIRLGKLANPAWGHTIGEDEYLNDWRESQSRTTETLDFLMYRLNVWQAAVSLWLPAGCWADCGDSELSLNDFANRECTIGLDLSRTRDMTAAVLAFPEYGDNGIETVTLWPQFWLPKAYAYKHRNDADFMGWQAKGLLTLTEGNEISTGEIYKQIQEWSQKFDVRGLFYDPYGATVLTQLIEQGLTDSRGNQFLDALNIERFPIPQRGHVMSSAIDDFESRVRAGSIRHPSNAVLDWQVGNTGIEDSGGRTCLAKPERDSVKKIDGVVAAVMAMAGLHGMEGQQVHTKCGIHVLGSGSESEWDDDDD